MFWEREVGLSGEFGEEGVALGVASWMCGGRCGERGWWSGAGHLGLGFGGLKGKALSSIASGFSGTRSKWFGVVVFPVGALGATGGCYARGKGRRGDGEISFVLVFGLGYFSWLAWVREMIFLGWRGSIGPCLVAVCDAALRCLRSLPLNHGDLRIG